MPETCSICLYLYPAKKSKKLNILSAVTDSEKTDKAATERLLWELFDFTTGEY